MGGKSEKYLDCVKYMLPVYSPSSRRDNEEAAGSGDEVTRLPNATILFTLLFRSLRTHEYLARKGT
jgi:hypothetical protein